MAFELKVVNRRTVATVPDSEMQKYMSSPMNEKEIAGTKALGQAVLGLVERAEQCHAKLSRLEAQCARMKNVLYVAVMSSTGKLSGEGAFNPHAVPSSEDQLGALPGGAAPQGDDARYKSWGHGTLAQSSMTDFINLQGSINPEGDS